MVLPFSRKKGIYIQMIKLKVYCDGKSPYILIRENHIGKAGFKEGDFYSLEIKDNQLILNKQEVTK